MSVAKAGDLALLVTAERKEFLVKLQEAGNFQTHRGVLRFEDLVGRPWGSVLHTHLGHPVALLRPSLRDILLKTQRRSQILFPKDIGYVLLRLSVRPGMTVVEAGTGSGALTTALAWAVGPEGRVITYDRRQDMQDLARKNLARVGLEQRVTFKLRDIAEGIDEREVEALFIDVPRPEAYLAQVSEALAGGGIFGTILPTANQVSALLASLEAHGLGLAEVCEVLLRFYKTVPERLRPVDRMVAHTGYLVFGRKLLGDLTPAEPTEAGEEEG